MKNQQTVDKTAAFIKEKFMNEYSGHDWWHMYRVWQLAKHIAKEEKGPDVLVVELAALLHDIADFKFYDGDLEAGPKAARQWLRSLKVDDKTIAHVEDIIRNISFKGAGVKLNLKTLEGQIVHDADKLDAIGAIGLARVFAYSGVKGIPIFHPEIDPTLHTSFEEYKHNSSTSINHFHEKLLLLKDRMFTKTGKQMAAHRHKYLQDFLEEFHKEWNGKA
ncbi:phosphohydrolase [bacterium G20]|nr:phosphohydrolase [bacterium G20]